jgi:lysophospholipase L1-like esterase
MNPASDDRPDEIVVLMIGDSTMAIRPTMPPVSSYGWGQKLGEFLDETVTIKNRARSGRSTKSFIAEGLWGMAHAELAAGDYMIIQFGANDQKVHDPERFTEPYGAYQKNLRRFIDSARKKGAIPILATPICRRDFDRNGQFRNNHGEWTEAARAVAAEQGVPLLDLQRDTENLLRAMGPEQSKVLFWHVAPGLYPELPQGRSDNSHLSETGARTIAEFAAKALKATDIPLAARVRGV